jgi:hypothetical protein
MVLQRYRVPSRGRSMQEAAEVGMDIGYKLLKESALSNYNTQMSKAQIQSLEDKRELDAELDKNWQEPDEWESIIFANWWPKHIKKMTEGKKGKALKDINESLQEEKQITLNYIQERRWQQEKINNQASFDVLKENLVNADFKNALQLTKYSKDFLGRLDELYKSGDIPELRSEQAVIEQHDKLFSPIVMNFIITQPDKIDEDGNVFKNYWIEHPNEFVEENALFSEEGRSLFTAKEAAELKRDYEYRKNVNEYQAKVLRENRENEVEMEARKLAIAGDWQGGINIINGALDELGDDWQTDALNKFQNAFRITNTKGENPFIKTQSYEKFTEIRQEILDEKIKSEREIRKWTGKKDGYAIPQEKYLLDLYKGDESSSKAFENTAAAKLIKEMLEDWEEGVRIRPEMVNILREKGYRLLEDAIQAAEKPLTERQKKEKALSIYNSLILEASTITTKPEALLTPKDIAEREQYFVRKGLAPGEFMGAIPQPKTKAEFDKLPSGTIFLAPDGKRRKKP